MGLMNLDGSALLTLLDDHATTPSWLINGCHLETLDDGRAFVTVTNFRRRRPEGQSTQYYGRIYVQLASQTAGEVTLSEPHVIWEDGTWGSFSAAREEVHRVAPNTFLYAGEISTPNAPEVGLLVLFRIDGDTVTTLDQAWMYGPNEYSDGALGNVLEENKVVFFTTHFPPRAYVVTTTGDSITVGPRNEFGSDKEAWNRPIITSPTGGVLITGGNAGFRFTVSGTTVTFGDPVTTTGMPPEIGGYDFFFTEGDRFVPVPDTTDEYLVAIYRSAWRDNQKLAHVKLQGTQIAVLAIHDDGWSTTDTDLGGDGINRYDWPYLARAVTPSGQSAVLHWNAPDPAVPHWKPPTFRLNPFGPEPYQDIYPLPLDADWYADPLWGDMEPYNGEHQAMQADAGGFWVVITGYAISHPNTHGRLAYVATYVPPTSITGQLELTRRTFGRRRDS